MGSARLNPLFTLNNLLPAITIPHISAAPLIQEVARQAELALQSILVGSEAT